METQVQLPPSGRDFDVYRLVKIEQRSTRAAAAAVGISQTRVCQVIERVAQFLIEATPATEDDERHGRRLRVAQQVAAERIDFLYALAVRSYRQSKGAETTVREVETGLRPKVTITTTRNSYGDGRILMAAANMVMLAAKLPVPLLGIGGEGEVDELEALAIPLEEDDLLEEDPPLKEDCSAVAGEQGAEAAERLQQDAASRLQEINYMKDVLAKMRAKMSQPAPVQPAVSPESPATESQPPAGRPLSSGELKSRKAFLAQAP